MRQDESYLFVFQLLPGKIGQAQTRGAQWLICGCVCAEMLHAGNAAEVSLEARSEAESYSKIQINHLATGMTKPSEIS